MKVNIESSWAFATDITCCLLVKGGRKETEDESRMERDKHKAALAMFRGLHTYLSR